MTIGDNFCQFFPLIFRFLSQGWLRKKWNRWKNHQIVNTDSQSQWITTGNMCSIFFQIFLFTAWTLKKNRKSQGCHHWIPISMSDHWCKKNLFFYVTFSNVDMKINENVAKSRNRHYWVLVVIYEYRWPNSELKQSWKVVLQWMQILFWIQNLTCTPLHPAGVQWGATGCNGNLHPIAPRT